MKTNSKLSLNTHEETEANMKHEGYVEARISKMFDNLASTQRLIGLAETGIIALVHHTTHVT